MNGIEYDDWVPSHVREYLKELGYRLPLDDMEPYILECDEWMSAIRDYYDYHEMRMVLGGSTRCIGVPSNRQYKLSCLDASIQALKCSGEVFNTGKTRTSVWHLHGSQSDTFIDVELKRLEILAFVVNQH